MFTTPPVLHAEIFACIPESLLRYVPGSGPMTSNLVLDGAGRLSLFINESATGALLAAHLDNR